MPCSLWSALTRSWKTYWNKHPQGRTERQGVRRLRGLSFQPLEQRTMLAVLPELVRDIFPGGSSGNLSQFTEVNGTLYFQATDGTNGRELWKSDGSSAGTVLVKDIFVAKLNSSGAFIWARQLGGISNDQGNGISVDAAGNVFTTGVFADVADFDPGVGSHTLEGDFGSNEIFVSKLTSAGAFAWARNLGGPVPGSTTDEGLGIAVDTAGNVFTTGFFQGTADFDPGAGTSNLTSAGSSDIFVSKLTSTGNFSIAVGFGAAAGGVNIGAAVATDAAGNAYTTGYFRGTVDFDPGPGASLLTAAGLQNIFVSKLDSAGNFVWARQLGGSGGNNVANGIAVDASGNVLTTGSFQGTADFDPGAGTSNLTSAGNDKI